MELISTCYSIQLIESSSSTHSPPLHPMMISIAAVAPLIHLYTSLSFLIHISVGVRTRMLSLLLQNALDLDLIVCIVEEIFETQEFFL